MKVDPIHGGGDMNEIIELYMQTRSLRTAHVNNVYMYPVFHYLFFYKSVRLAALVIPYNANENNMKKYQTFVALSIWDRDSLQSVIVTCISGCCQVTFDVL